jgi:tetratricopeptide (TPR) repeat protein
MVPARIGDKKRADMRNGLLLLLLVLVAAGAGAQNKLVREGNQLYSEKKYVEAAEAYKKALEKSPTNTPGMFNMGNALFRQKNYAGARQVLETTASQARDRNVKADANYNIGNTYMEEKKWQEAVESYKKALRVNPQDEAAKYNLSYAQAMLKKDQGGGGKDKNKDEQNQDQKKDENKDQQDKQDQKEQQQDQQDQKDKQEQDQKEQQQQPSKLSEQQAEQLLNALSQEEKKLHDKKEKGKAVPVKMDKDW